MRKGLLLGSVGGFQKILDLSYCLNEIKSQFSPWGRQYRFWGILVEYIFIVIGALVVIGLIAIKWIKFVIFKSELMNEFGRQGVSYQDADQIFTKFGNQISMMHHSGMPVEKIVYLTMTAIGNVQSRRQNEEVNNIINQKDLIIVSIASGLIMDQYEYINNDDFDCDKVIADDWTIAYVGGIADSLLQSNGIGTDKRGYLIMGAIFEQVFGVRRGLGVFEKFTLIQASGDENASKVMLAAGNEVFDWVRDENKKPTAWANYLLQLEADG